MRLVRVLLVMAGSATYALAGTAAPEIDASSRVAAIGLITGGLVVLRARGKK